MLYIIVMAISVFGYMVLHSMRIEQTAEVPKYRKLQELSNVILTCFGMIGLVGSRTVLNTDNTVAKLMLLVILGILVCVAAVCQIRALWLMRNAQKSEESI